MEFLDPEENSEDTWSLKQEHTHTHTHAGHDYAFPQVEDFVDTKLLEHINSGIASLHTDGGHKLPAHSLLSDKNVPETHAFLLWALLLIQHQLPCRTLLALMGHCRYLPQPGIQQHANFLRQVEAKCPWCQALGPGRGPWKTWW